MADVTVRPITRLLVANRGEIARRIMNSARDRGISTVAVYADADATAPFVRDADMAVALQGETPQETYLQIDKVLDACRRTGADAVHPGYGFLSENPGFARAVIEAGMTWVGPPPEAIAAMGDKLSAKRLMQEADVPTLPARYVVPATDARRAWREQSWIVAHLNCSGCHRLGKEDDPHVARYFELKNLVPPSLQDVGARLQGQYLYQFLMEPSQVRPWMTMRMPDFGFDEDDARTLVAGFAARDGVTNPHTYAASQKIPEDKFQRGVRRFRHYKCVQCHPTC